jgi:subtilisin
MRRAAPLALAILLAFTGVSGARAAESRTGSLTADPAAETAGSLSAAGRWIVLLKSGAGVTAATQRARGLGIRADRVFRHSAHGYAARISDAQVATLRRDPAVAAVVPDEIISVAGQSVPRGVRRVGGSGSLVSRIDGVDDRVDADVAIVDTGIDPHHVDLNVVGGINCSSDNPDAWADPNGHGTHVAGTVGAIDNGTGVVGVAPGVRLWAVRILNSAGSGLLSWYVCGLDWIAAQRDPSDPGRPLIEAVNMSVAKLGSDDGNCGLTNHDVVHQAICRLVASGVTVVAAAGNNSFNASRLIPASYDEVITVSALADTDGRPGGLGGHLCYSWGTYDRDDTFANFSNYGRDVDLIAPGKCTWSTLPGNRYGWMSGTSMAAPLVTGAAALYKASRPGATPSQVKAALIAAGNRDWSTSTDPDSVHEPLLDVSHIVAAGDFTVDATPGVVRTRLVAAGGSVTIPVEVIRAEDFADPVELTLSPQAPLGAAPAVETVTATDNPISSVTISAPPGAASGSYSVVVAASDGTRRRTSTVSVMVDGDAPVARRPVLGIATGGRLTSGSFRGLATWASAADPTSAIAGYEAQWRVDGGDWGSTMMLGATTRQVARTMKAGHSYALRVRARDSVGNWSAWVDSGPGGARVTEERSSSLTRVGKWSVHTSTLASGGSTIFGRVSGAYVRLNFTGRSVALVAPKAPYRGRASVWIDGHKSATIDFLRSAMSPRLIVFSRSWSVAGKHSIRVVVAGTAGRPRIDVDAFVVLQ